MTLFALLPSPLLGPLTWEPVATVLRARGHEVANPAFGELAPVAPRDALQELSDAIPADREVVLVAHSNAGYYVPALAADRQVAAVIFVDAALPPFDAPRTCVAPPRFFDFLAAKADADGVLPVWTEWWEDVDELFPSKEVGEAVQRQQRRFPLPYFTQELDVPPDWKSLPCAYLAFGETYSEEVDAARDRGWPVACMAGGHLEMLAHPDAVTLKLLGLLTFALESAGRRVP